MEANRFSFRAWDGECMISDVTDAFIRADDGVVCELITTEYGQYIVERHDWTLMQSTGLTDANGVEIFEGDVLEAGAGPLLICWRNGCFKLMDHGGYYIGLEGWHNNEHLKVIGNIHENPELMEAKQ